MAPKEFDRIDRDMHDFYMMLCARIDTGSMYRVVHGDSS